MDDKAITILKRGGVHFKFQNGLTASIMIGPGSYSDNYWGIGLDSALNIKSDTAEVAVLLEDTPEKCELVRDIDIFLPESKQGCDQVAGYLTLDEVMDFLNNVRNWSGDINTLKEV